MVGGQSEIRGVTRLSKKKALGAIPSAGRKERRGKKERKEKI
jgi:hypothetical protein